MGIDGCAHCVFASRAGRAQAADPGLGVTVRFRPERSGYLTFHNVEAPPQVPAEHGARQWLYMIGDARREGRASSTMWRDEHGRISGPPRASASRLLRLPLHGGTSKHARMSMRACQSELLHAGGGQ